MHKRAKAKARHCQVTTSQSFLLELGSEELPQDVADGIAQLEQKMAALLAHYKLAYGSLRVTGDAPPGGVCGRPGADTGRGTGRKRGPALGQAYDTSASRRRRWKVLPGQGVAVANLEVENYVWAVKHVAGAPTQDVLPKLCLELLNSLRWGKTMRWNSSGIGFPRPLRWIVALYGAQVVPITWPM